VLARAHHSLHDERAYSAGQAQIEAMLAQYGAQLNEHFEKFESHWVRDHLAGLQEVQIMLGFMTTILAKSGIKEA
jgi:hypothetical protein